MRHLLIFVGVITGLYAIVSSYDNRYDLTTVFASISLLSFIGAAQFDPDKKLEDILENLDEEPNLQPVVKKEANTTNNFVNLHDLEWDFDAYISKPFPNKYLTSNDPYFEKPNHIIAIIKGYNFKRGREKENQLLDKIKAHNEIIANRSKQKKSSQNINQQEITDKIINGLHEKRERQRIADFYYDDLFDSISIDNFKESIAMPFPDMYLEINDSFFDDFKKELNEIEQEGGDCKKASNLLQERINEHNENFIQRHLCDPIFSSICGYSLDREQRRAILCDSKHNLVVAGAGTGKTLTICGKIQYLLENNLATEDEILLMSYSRDSVDDINKKVARVSAKMKAETFHSIGYEILTRHYGEKKAIEEQILSHIKTFFDERLSSDSKLLKKIFKYFSCYIRSITLDFEKKRN